MKALDEYVIQFSGLRQGLHKFDFKVDDKFFVCFENSEITKGNIRVTAVVDKKSVLLIINLVADGEVFLPCDRCGDDMAVKVKNTYRFIVKLGNEENSNEDDVIFLPLKEYEINIAQQIYEVIALAVPFQRIHSKGKCNEQVIKQIRQLETVKSKTKKEVDPRWDALKVLKKKK